MRDEAWNALNLGDLDEIPIKSASEGKSRPVVPASNMEEMDFDDKGNEDNHQHLFK